MIRVVLICLTVLVGGCGARQPVEVARNGAAATSADSESPGTAALQRPVRGATRADDLALRASPLVDGERALDSWLSVIGSAQGSIRLKTFIFRRDPVGRRLEGALISAADRGVKVKILLDDFFYRLEAGDLTALDAHPNIELRLFNPYGRALPAAMQLVVEHPTVGRRMHNKLLLVDDRVAIIGGRNIADEYFRRDPSQYFADFDLLVDGAGVARFAPAFDQFWRDPLSVPLRRLQRAAPETAVRMSTSAGEHGERAVASPVPIRRSQPAFAARASLHWDAPDRVRGVETGGRGAVEGTFLSALAGAQREVLIVTPYLIPEPHGAKMLKDLARRGVKVTILTNSHASTNHPSVHAGYRRYRRQLLELGVRIHEFRGNVIGAFREGEGDFRPSVVMHAKLAVIDRRITLTGSANFDPRSLRQNTEILIRLDSADLSRWLLERYDDILRRYSYALRLGQDGTERWVDLTGAKPADRKVEPVGRFLDGAVTTFFQLVPFDQHL